MPVERIDLGKGSYSNVDEISTQEGVSPLVQNGFLDDLGANVKVFGAVPFPIGGSLQRIGNQECQGLFFSTTLGVWIACADRKIKKIDANGTLTTLSGVVLEANGSCSFFEAPALTSSGTYAPHVFVANGGSIYYTDGTTVTQLTGTNAPTACGSIVFTDYQMVAIYDKRFFVHSEPNDLLNLGDSTNLIAADSSPDDNVALAVVNRELLVFGKRSIDTFYYSSLGSTATWVKTPGGFNPDYGLGSRTSLVTFGNVVYFLNHKREVCRYAGRQVQVISTSIARTLETLNTVSDAIATKVDFRGKHFYWLTFPSENLTYAYDMQMDCWYQMGDWDDSVGILNAHVLTHFAYNENTNRYLIGQSTGHYAALSADATEYDQVKIRFARRTGFINHGTDRRHKRCNRIAFRVKSGQEVYDSSGAATYTTSPSKVFMFRYRDENQGWSNWMYPSLKAVGYNEFYAETGPHGQYRARQWEIAQTDNVPFTLVSMEEDFDILR